MNSMGWASFGASLKMSVVTSNKRMHSFKDEWNEEYDDLKCYPCVGSPDAHGVGT